MWLSETFSPEGGFDHLARDEAAVFLPEVAEEVLAKGKGEEAALFGEERWGGEWRPGGGGVDAMPSGERFGAPDVVEEAGFAVGDGEQPEFPVRVREGAGGGGDDGVGDEGGFVDDQ